VPERPWCGPSEGPKPPLGCQVLARSRQTLLENRASVRLCGTCWEPLKTAGQPCDEHLAPQRIRYDVGFHDATRHATLRNYLILSLILSYLSPAGQRAPRLPPQCALMRACAWLVWAVLVRSARTEAEGSLSAQFGDGAYKQPTWDRRDEEQSQARPLSRPRASRSHALSAVGARLCDR
jgi:hypothetical protein